MHASHKLLAGNLSLVPCKESQLLPCIIAEPACVQKQHRTPEIAAFHQVMLPRAPPLLVPGHSPTGKCLQQQHLS